MSHLPRRFEFYAYKQNVAYALQSDGAYKLNDWHTLRAGVFAQSDRSKSTTSSQVIALDPSGSPGK